MPVYDITDPEKLALIEWSRKVTPTDWKPQCESVKCIIKTQHPSARNPHTWKEVQGHGVTWKPLKNYKRLTKWERMKIAFYYRFAGKFGLKWILKGD
jgi:hypothetical protein